MNPVTGSSSVGAGVRTFNKVSHNRALHQSSLILKNKSVQADISLYDEKPRLRDRGPYCSLDLTILTASVNSITVAASARNAGSMWKEQTDCIYVNVLDESGKFNASRRHYGVLWKQAWLPFLYWRITQDMNSQLDELKR